MGLGREVMPELEGIHVLCGHTGNNEHMRYLRECLQREGSTRLWENKEESEKETGK